MSDGGRCLASLLILGILGFQIVPIALCADVSRSAFCSRNAETSIAPLDVCDSGSVFAGQTSTYLWLLTLTPPSPVVRGGTIDFSLLADQLPEGFLPSVFRPPRPVRSLIT